MFRAAKRSDPVQLKRSDPIQTSADPASSVSEPQAGSLSESLNKLRVLTKFNQELGNNVHNLNHEMHEERMKKLRALAGKLKEDSWKYPAPSASVDKLLSL